MSAEIIDFTTRHRTPAADDAPLGPLTPTAKNQRLRGARREAWNKVDRCTEFQHAWLKYVDAVRSAKHLGVKEVHGHHAVSDEDRWALLHRYQKALGNQLLTPAPDMATVNWKRRQMNMPGLPLIVDVDMLDQSIADDIAFLEAHPTKRAKQATS